MQTLGSPGGGRGSVLALGNGGRKARESTKVEACDANTW